MSYNPPQKNVGYGPPGRFYDYSIIIESQQACGSKIEIEVIIDDRLRSEFIAYSIGNSTKKTVRLTDYDRDRSLKYAILSLPSTAKEVTIECLDNNGPIGEQCCIYDLYKCSFSGISVAGKSAPHGKRKEGGASFTYGGDEFQDSYQQKKSDEARDDKGFFGRVVSFTVDLTFLVVRCYLGAMIAKNMGFRSLDNDTYEDYVNNLNMVWKECHRVLHSGCRLCINVGDQFARSVYYGRYKVIPIRTEIIKFCESVGFDYMGAIIWQKVTTCNTTGGATVMGSFPSEKWDYQAGL